MTMSKHILNDPKTLVNDALSGLAFLNPALTYNPATMTVMVRQADHDKVHLLCGGGAGHEPAHAAFVGKGMLSAAVSGNVFASPNAAQIEAALGRLSNSKGQLIIVKNYTGDVLHFGLVKERWAATHLGEDSVRLLVVGDDVSVGRAQGQLTGRRGLAATVLVYKIAGALADTGASLDEVEHLAKFIARRSGTCGIGLDHCHVPGTEQAEGYLQQDELEFGLGIHNETGVRKQKPIPSANRIVEDLMKWLTDTEDKDRAFLDFKSTSLDEVILLVNNLGGISEIELSVVVNEASKWLASKHITVERVLSGAFMTSLNLPGFSISLVLLPREPVATPSTFTSNLCFDKDLILEMLDAPTEAPAWKWHYKGRPEAHVEEEKDDQKNSKKRKTEVDISGSDQVKGPAPTDAKLFKSAIEAALQELAKAEAEITKYDTTAGDGDAGLTLKAGAEALQTKILSDVIPTDKDVVATLVGISAVVEKEMGGTSGGLYSIFFAALSKGVLQAAKDKGENKATNEVWARALELALNTLYNYTLARPPSRTLVDPLAAFIITFGSDPANFDNAFNQAQEAAEATRALVAKAGRAAYVDQDKIEKANVPDAGAWGVLKILQGVKAALARESSSTTETERGQE
ncbi:BZ3500_MvSof-1268-A1-R1_Chr1-3g01807 [Microbotryum saponariae]|uniref:BZ3500_MvSof-1268-A1-R1_Chr1-3g01807 protein n=1 Tax=Microbotryum saponariae TaxID=289078 RepID=A0A2X0L3G9_9BASI|nr:BZ3500_MvSof-1268-A1-R1_Chr1-3g01807 [Microbotryum saponariae]SCZ94627.1 BZ3501_MvSof-1269-A2-R1_Chr1-3g01409 [Microbotryum saponariae]